jgi:hypothetical protein
MTAGCITLGAILLSIGIAAIKSFPSFARHVRIGVLLAAGRDLKHLRLPSRARIIPFRAGRTAAW